MLNHSFLGGGRKINRQQLEKKVTTQQHKYGAEQVHMAGTTLPS